MLDIRRWARDSWSAEHKNRDQLYTLHRSGASAPIWCKNPDLLPRRQRRVSPWPGFVGAPQESEQVGGLPLHSIGRFEGRRQSKPGKWTRWGLSEGQEGEPIRTEAMGGPASLVAMRVSPRPSLDEC